MNLPKNHFKHAILAGKPQIGLWCSYPTFQTVESIATSGFEWLLLDMEHTPNDMVSLNGQLVAVQAGGSNAIVRPPWNDMVMIKRCLDVGAQTLLIPYVQNADEARAAVAATRFPHSPQGNGVRGVASSTRAAGYGRIKDYLKLAANEICVLVQVETPEAMEHLEAICAVEGVDGVFIGPNDLAAGMGHVGDIPNPRVQAAIKDAFRRIKACGKAPGILVGDAQGQEMLDAGALFVAVGSDVGILTRGADAMRAKFAK